MDNFNINSFVNSLNRRLDAPVKSHLKNVYTCLSLSTLTAGVGAYVHVFTSILQGNFLTSLAALGFMIGLSATPYNEGKNQNTRLGLLLAFSFCTGLGLGPLVDMALHIDPSIIATAFLGTCLIFVCFTLSAIYSEQRKWLYLGGTLMSITSVLVLLGFANIFWGSKLLFQVHLYLGLAVFCAFILYDTQAIIEKRLRHDKDYIWHSVDLFLDLVNIFRHLLIILMQNQDDKKKKRRSD